VKGQTVRMSQRYPVQTMIPDLKAVVGWDRAAGSYWFVTWWAGRNPETDAEDYAGGEDDRISDVGELVRRTWGTLDWSNELGVLRMLRDDPWLESVTEYGRTPGYADLLAAAFDPVELAASEGPSGGRLKP
jgi:hypothetical protein